MTGCPRLIGQERSALWSREEATGSEQQRGKDQGGVRVLLFFVIVPLRSSSFHFTLLLFRLFLFRQVKQQAGHERKAPDGRNAADGANGYAFFYVFALSTLLFYSYHSSSFPIISFQRSITTGGQDGAAMATPDGTRGDRQARQVRLLLILKTIAKVLCVTGLTEVVIRGMKSRELPTTTICQRVRIQFARANQPISRVEQIRG